MVDSQVSLDIASCRFDVGRYCCAGGSEIDNLISDVVSQDIVVLAEGVDGTSILVQEIC
jgi:hypothetical protein